MLYLVCNKSIDIKWKKKLIHIIIDNVTFSYDDRQTALNGISFTIPKGAKVALCGPSGGG
jgi:ABC-type multidrug transport system fused ATPase/permease subunit